MGLVPVVGRPPFPPHPCPPAPSADFMGAIASLERRFAELVESSAMAGYAYDPETGKYHRILVAENECGEKVAYASGEGVDDPRDPRLAVDPSGVARLAADPPDGLPDMYTPARATGTFEGTSAAGRASDMRVASRGWTSRNFARRQTYGFRRKARSGGKDRGEWGSDPEVLSWFARCLGKAGWEELETDTWTPVPGTYPVSRNDPDVNVADFGRLAGEADDSGRVQRAVLAACSAQSDDYAPVRRVLFTEPAYVLKHTVYVPAQCTLWGQSGAGAPVVKVKTGITGFCISGDRVGIHGLRFQLDGGKTPGYDSSWDEVEPAAVRFDKEYDQETEVPQRAANGSGGDVQLAYVEECFFEDLYVGVHFVDARTFRVDHCLFNHARKACVIVENRNRPDSGDGFITSCEFAPSANDGDGNFGAGVLQRSAGGLKIVGCKFIFGEYGYRGEFSAYRGTSILAITGCSFELMSKAAVSVKTVLGNTYSYSSASGRWSFADLAFRKGVITGNQFTIHAGQKAVELDGAATRKLVQAVADPPVASAAVMADGAVAEYRPDAGGAGEAQAFPLWTCSDTNETELYGGTWLQALDGAGSPLTKTAYHWHAVPGGDSASHGGRWVWAGDPGPEGMVRDDNGEGQPVSAVAKVLYRSADGMYVKESADVCLKVDAAKLVQVTLDPPEPGHVSEFLIAGNTFNYYLHANDSSRSVAISDCTQIAVGANQHTASTAPLDANARIVKGGGSPVISVSGQVSGIEIADQHLSPYFTASTAVDASGVAPGAVSLGPREGHVAGPLAVAGAVTAGSLAVAGAVTAGSADVAGRLDVGGKLDVGSTVVAKGIISSGGDMSRGTDADWNAKLAEMDGVQDLAAQRAMVPGMTSSYLTDSYGAVAITAKEGQLLVLQANRRRNLPALGYGATSRHAFLQLVTDKFDANNKPVVLPLFSLVHHDAASSIDGADNGAIDSFMDLFNQYRCTEHGLYPMYGASRQQSLGLSTKPWNAVYTKALYVECAVPGSASVYKRVRPVLNAGGDAVTGWEVVP